MLKDEDLYTKAMKEYDAGRIQPDLKTKALVLANGDKELAKFQYVKLRVEQLKRDNLKKLPGDLAIGAMAGLQAIKQSRTEARDRKAAEKAAAKEQARREREANHRPYPLVPLLIVVAIAFAAFFALVSQQ